MIFGLIFLFSYLTIHALCDLRVVSPVETIDLGVTVTAFDYGNLDYASSNFIAATPNGLNKVVFDNDGTPNKLSYAPLTASGFPVDAEKSVDRISFAYLNTLKRLFMRKNEKIYRFTVNYDTNIATQVEERSLLPENCGSGSYFYADINVYTCLPNRFTEGQTRLRLVGRTSGMSFFSEDVATTNDYNILSVMLYPGDSSLLVFAKANNQTAGSQGYEIQVFNRDTESIDKKYTYEENIFELSYYILSRMFLVAQKSES